MTWRTLTADEKTAVDIDFGQPFGTCRPNPFQQLLISISRHSVLRRGSFRRLMTSLILKLGSSKLDVMFRNAAYRIYGQKNLIEYGLLLNPAYNSVEIDFLQQDSAQDSNFVDIGCNIGLYALPLGVASPKGITLAIDANPKMAARIRWNAEASQASNIRVISAAISDANGSCGLSIRKDDLAIVVIEEKADGDIPVRLLQDVVQEAGLSSIHGLKIDIEGHEDKALVPFLDGAPHSLLPRRIVIEHPAMDRDYPGCTEAFKRRGYRLIGRTRNNSLYQLNEASA